MSDGDNPGEDPGIPVHWSWIDFLNSFLERAFLQADVDTGC